MKFDQIIASAVMAWGEREQSAMAMEEAGELIRAINKLQRDPHNEEKRQNLIEEMADCWIMAEQLKFMYGINEDEITAEVNHKIARLETMVEKKINKKSTGLPPDVIGIYQKNGMQHTIYKDTLDQDDGLTDE